MMTYTNVLFIFPCILMYVYLSMFATYKKPIIGAFTACVAAFVFELLVMITILLKEAAAARLCHHLSTVAHNVDLLRFQ